MAHAGLSSRTTPLRQLELRCPPLPQTLTEALRLLNDPDRLGVNPVTAMVERDPVVVAHLLRTVNSAYYGLRRSISSARRAVVLLGPVSVAGIVAGMNVLKLHAIIDGPAAACFARLIRHSVATGYLTRFLHERFGKASRDAGPGSNSFTAGLLHDFGKIVLVYNFPREANAFYEKQQLARHVTDSDPRYLEQLTFGCDHTEAGEFAARKLNFPDTLTDVIRLHHAAPAYDDTDADGTTPLLRLTAAANSVAKAMGYAFHQPLDWEACTHSAAWQRMAARDLPPADTPEVLLDALQDHQPQLDEYVTHMTTPPRSTPRPLRRL